MGADEFYDKVGTLAETHGVMINLVTIAGAEANIQCLSRMCELSGGQIEQVQPHELEQDFAAIHRFRDPETFNAFVFRNGGERKVCVRARVRARAHVCLCVRASSSVEVTRLRGGDVRRRAN